MHNFPENKSKVLVIGLGYVGLPLMEALLKSNKFSVSGFDISLDIIDLLKRESGDFKGVNLSELNSYKPKYFSDATDLDRYDIFIICVPTPLANGNPDLNMICQAGELIAKNITKGCLVILESTSYPGTTESILLPILEKSKLKVGVDFFLAFGSERTDPGNPYYSVKNTPKVVGGIDKLSTDKAVGFYENFIDDIIVAKGTKEAELSKLLENTYRIVNIALVNELAILCHELEIDIWDTIRCASSKPFGFQTFYPGPGVGGHCIPVDPIYLSKYISNKLDKNFEFIELAQKINKGMPLYVLSRVNDILKLLDKKLENSTILVIGASYKHDISDTRESPILDIIKGLISSKSNFVIYDSHVSELKVDSKIFKIEKKLPENLSEFDLIIVLQHHSDLDVKGIVRSKIPILDTRGRIQEAERL